MLEESLDLVLNTMYLILHLFFFTQSTSERLPISKFSDEFYVRRFFKPKTNQFDIFPAFSFKIFHFLKQ